MKHFLLVSLFFFVGLTWLSGQIKPPEKSIVPEDYDPSEFPIWTHDLRRFEVITFGSFPITYFFSSLIYDLVLAATNMGDVEYSLGSQRGDDDIPIILGIAGITSVAVGLTDLIINISKRKNENKNEQRMLHRADP